jgi:hypothetical protein
MIDIRQRSALSTRFRAGLLVAAVATAAGACSSSSFMSGQPVTIGDVTRNYDHTYDSLTNGTKSEHLLASVIPVFNGVIADSVIALLSPISTGNLQKAWFGNFANFVDSAGDDSVQVVTFWYSVQVQAFVTLIYHNGVFVDSLARAAIQGDTVPRTDSGSTITKVAFTTRSGACQFTPIANVSTQYPTYDPDNTTCALASANLNGFVYFPADSTNPISFNPVTLPTSPITGVRLQFTSSAAYPFSAPLGSIRARAAARIAIGPRRR